MKRSRSDKNQEANTSAKKVYMVNENTKIYKASAENASDLSVLQLRPFMSSPKFNPIQPHGEKDQSRIIERVLPCFQKACFSCPAKTWQSVEPELDIDNEIKDKNYMFKPGYLEVWCLCLGM